MILLLIVMVVALVIVGLFVINRKTLNLEFVHECVYPDCDFKFASNDKAITQYVVNAHNLYHKTGDVSIVSNS